MQTKNTATRYSKEFRESMIALNQTGRSANSLSKEYNVSVSALAKWIRQADPFDRNVLSIKERELLKENKRLKEEIYILKRAAVLLARIDGQRTSNCLTSRPCKFRGKAPHYSYFNSP